MLQEDIAIKNPFHRFEFTLASLAASQTDTVIPRNAQTNGALMPYGGSIVGIAAALSAAKADGDLTFTITVNGTATAFTQAVADTDQYVYSRKDADVVKFAAGDRVGVTYTSGADLDPDGSADVTVDVYVMFEDVEL